MADREPSAWQAHHVAKFGPNTLRFNNLFVNAPFRVFSGNAPIGANVGTTASPLEVEGPYVKIRLSFPRDIEDPEFTFTGKIRVYRRTRAFSRDHLDVSDPAEDTDKATLVAALDFSSELLGFDRDSYSPALDRIDHPDGEPGIIWYYTAFYEYEDADKNLWWAFDPGHSHSRAMTYRQNFRPDGENYSPMGDRLFNYQPRRFRELDHSEGDDTLYRLMQSIGRVFDAMGEDLEHVRDTRADIENVDFSRIPYIDWLLAWPTNYELPEDARRVETAQAVNLWKAKGTFASLELALQTITGWDVRVVEGWPWVLNTATNSPELDPDNPPDGWDEETDGVWADLVGSRPVSATVNADDIRVGSRLGTVNDVNTYTVSTEQVSSTGIGYRWQNPNGVLVLLTSAREEPIGLPEVIVRKVHRMAPLFAAHYAAFSVVAVLSDLEQWAPFGEDPFGWEDEVIHVDGEQWQPFGDIEFSDVDPTRCLLHTYPHPVYPLISTTNNPLFVTAHAWLQFGCDLEDEDDPMPQSIVLANAEVVPHASPAKVVNQFVFDASAYTDGRVFYFQAVGHVGGPTGGKSMTVVLKNLTDGNTVATLTCTLGAPTSVSSLAIPRGVGAGNLADASKLYEVEITLVGSDDVSDYGHLGSAVLRVE